MNLNHTFFLVILYVTFTSSATYADVVTLDSCRAMALAHNKQIRIHSEQVAAAHYRHRAARSAMFPSIDFSGGYLHNQKELSLLASDQYLPIITDGEVAATSVALIPKEAMTYDVRNLFFGAITITQPIYTGGKILALNRLSKYATCLAEAVCDNEQEEVLYKVDEAYWLVVSLSTKLQLTESYVALVDTLSRNVDAMVKEGVATRSDLLSVTVRLNEAQVDKSKVVNALVLARMNLARICGLDVDCVLLLAGEDLCDNDMELTISDPMSMALERPDLRALRFAINIAEQRSALVRSEMLPQIALVGAYTVSNPNSYNGFRRKFDGAFSVGVSISVPLWHWGGNYDEYRASKSDVTISRLALSEAEEGVKLQVRQAQFRMSESVKTLATAKANLAYADENLRQAELGFSEGLMTIDNVMEAQTAWLKARSEFIDAMIDINLCRSYMAKTLGILSYQ